MAGEKSEEISSPLVFGKRNGPQQTQRFYQDCLSRIQVGRLRTVATNKQLLVVL
jgi:hypothetical protein